MKAAEREIYEMLARENPEIPEHLRVELARDGAKHATSLMRHELATGEKAKMICECSHEDSEHVGGVGRCKDRECYCQGFIAKEVKLEVRQ